MNERVLNALVELGKFSNEEITMFGEKIEETYIYKKVESEIALLDSIQHLKQVLGNGQ